MRMKGMLYKAGLFLYALGLFLVLVAPTQAADAAMFSATSDKTNYVIGDTIKVSLSVDSGPYATTLNAIDMTIKNSDASVAAPEGSNPYTPGSIFSQVGLQSASGDSINVVTYINPSDKPASRSGYLGLITLKALKAGSTTISYDKIEAAEEGKDNEFVNTSASSLVITVGEASTQTVTTETISGSTISVEATPEATITPSAKTTTQAATTGPSELILVLIVGAGSAYIIYRIAAKSFRSKTI